MTDSATVEDANSHCAFLAIHSDLSRSFFRATVSLHHLWSLVISTQWIGPSPQFWGVKITIIFETTTSWWFQPIWKILVKLDQPPPRPPSFLVCCKKNRPKVLHPQPIFSPPLSITRAVVCRGDKRGSHGPWAAAANSLDRVYKSTETGFKIDMGVEPKIGGKNYPPNHPICSEGLEPLFSPIHFGGFHPYFWFNTHIP